MIISGSGIRLSSATKELMHHWHETREYWIDVKSSEFEHKYLEELVANVDRTVAVIDKLDKLITKIRHDCE